MSSKNLEAMVDEARLAFADKKYMLALNLFKKCLQLKFLNGCASLRLAIGYTLVKLGHRAKARIAFERALQLEPDNVPALVALGVMDINTNTIEKGVQRLMTAYEIDTDNPALLNQLANHFFYKNQPEIAELLAWYALHLTENQQMKSESCYHLGRCFQKKEEYEQAFKFYYQATRFDHPTFVLPHFGLGQMFIQRNDYESAISEFKEVLRLAPDNLDAEDALSSLCKLVAKKKADKEEFTV
uniref:Tetratricopeptide repeat protein n=1 Tax=Ditylenchus dipsaci TaxID=166011 RepID=A0A915CXQ3_9BILA